MKVVKGLDGPQKGISLQKNGRSAKTSYFLTAFLRCSLSWVVLKLVIIAAGKMGGNISRDFETHTSHPGNCIIAFPFLFFLDCILKVYTNVCQCHHHNNIRWMQAECLYISLCFFSRYTLFLCAFNFWTKTLTTLHTYYSTFWMWFSRNFPLSSSPYPRNFESIFVI